MSTCVTICCVCETKARIYKLREKIPEFPGAVVSGKQKEKNKFLKRFGGMLQRKLYRTFLSLA